MRVTLNATNTIANPAVLNHVSSSFNRPMKRLQYQVNRAAGVTASTVQLVGRLEADLPWVAIGSTITTATALGEIPPYPYLGVVLSAYTGTGNVTVDVNEPS